MENSIKILIVEDEMIIGANISLQLSELGYDVVGIVPRGEEALIHMEQNKPDIVLLDIVFPEDAQAGFKAAREIALQENLKSIPILILSAVNQLNNLGFSFTENDISPNFMPVSGFIEKPVKPNELLDKIGSFINN